MPTHPEPRDGDVATSDGWQSLPRHDMTVWVRFTFERQHRWMSAPDDELHRHLASFHRHLFHIEVGVYSGEDDREVSFEQLRSDARVRFMHLIPAQSGYSCERMARILGTALSHESADSSHWSTTYDVDYVTVSEDGESGATWRA